MTKTPFVQFFQKNTAKGFLLCSFFVRIKAASVTITYLQPHNSRYVALLVIGNEDINK